MQALRDKALLAIEEAATAAQRAPLPRTMTLRFTLAFLSNFATERWPFDQFWKEATGPVPDNGAQRFGRHQAINAAVSGIYHQLGLKRP